MGGLCSLRWMDVDLETGEYKAKRRGKIDRGYLDPVTIDMLKERQSRLKPEPTDRIIGVSVRTIERKIKYAARDIGIENWRDVIPHHLRALFLEIWDERRGIESIAQKLVHHSKPETTRRYLHKRRKSKRREEYLRVIAPFFNPEEEG